MSQTKQKGFTLVELLVVIAIIGLLSTLAVIALGSARSKARDARRISDIKQMQTALELYFADAGEYPQQGPSSIELGSTNAAVLCDLGLRLDDTGCSVTYMGQVPQNFPTPPTAGYDYLSDGLGYTIDFELEGNVGSLLKGTATASQDGVKN